MYTSFWYSYYNKWRNCSQYYRRNLVGLFVIAVFFLFWLSIFCTGCFLLFWLILLELINWLLIVRGLTMVALGVTKLGTGVQIWMQFCEIINPFFLFVGTLLPYLSTIFHLLHSSLVKLFVKFLIPLLCSFDLHSWDSKPCQFKNLQIWLSSCRLILHSSWANVRLFQQNRWEFLNKNVEKRLIKSLGLCRL